MARALKDAREEGGGMVNDPADGPVLAVEGETTVVTEGDGTAIGGRFFVTPHAVKAYQRRCRPDMSYDEALTHLIRASEQARRVKVLPTGAELWRTGKPERLRLVVQVDGEGRKPALVTVLTRAGAE